MSGILAPKPKGPSAEELRLRAEQEKKLKETEEAAKLEADRSRNQRLSSLRASRAGTIGSRSLIGTGSELGTSSEKLG